MIKIILWKENISSYTHQTRGPPIAAIADGSRRGDAHLGTTSENNADLRGSWLGYPRCIYADRFAKDPQMRRDARPISAA